LLIDLPVDLPIALNSLSYWLWWDVFSCFLPLAPQAAKGRSMKAPDVTSISERSVSFVEKDRKSS